MYTVGELSRLTGLTVRALHHYGAIGLCSPSARSPSGYRSYSEADVLRLQQVLLLRELGLPLRDIAGAVQQAIDRQMKARAAPSDPAVQSVVDQHRAHIDRWFYPRSREIHRGLGEMYVSDPRFTQNIDKVAAGLAQYMRDAIAAS